MLCTVCVCGLRRAVPDGLKRRTCACSADGLIVKAAQSHLWRLPFAPELGLSHLTGKEIVRKMRICREYTLNRVVVMMV